MRRRRTPKPRLQLVPEPAAPVDPRREKHYHTHNPMRENGAMPHELNDDGFIEFLILNGMTEDIYWLNVNAGEQQAIDIEENGIPVQSDKLTADQKGWAKADHYDHFLNEMARWRTVPGKDSKVVPYRFAQRLHDRDYRKHCDDGEKAKLTLWGYRWDMKELYQCQVCGEVVLSRTPAAPEGHRIVNPDWPDGEEPYIEKIDDNNEENNDNNN